MRTLVILGAFASLSAAETSDIIRRADRDDARYLAAGANHSAVVALGRAGDGTIIAPHWLLTAGHVAAAVRNRSSLEIGGRSYAIERVVHGAWRELGPHDVGLIRLASPI